MKKIILIIALATAAINLFSQEERMYVMENGKVVFKKTVSTIDSIIFYNHGIGEASPTTDPGVLINGVIWATRNLDAVGTFADTPEDYGKFYQWNRNVAWAATGAVTGWDNTNSAGSEWTEANDPSPEGWRVPTSEQLATLLDASKVTREWTTQNGITGRKFTDKTSGLSVFFPAAGYRTPSGGTLGSAGSYGSYWSSSQGGSDSAYGLYFTSSNAYCNSDGYRSSGFSVRAVAE
jgi:uncharacterized protein (TIGR02145 family)